MVAAGLAALFVVVPAGAQVRQYTAPGGAANEAEGRKEALEKAVEEARWHAGPLRLDPAFWISDLTFVDSPDSGADSDLTARAGLGLHGYLPVGSKTTIALYALPEYIWWKERDNERGVNQRFGAGVFTYFNRLSIEITAQRNEDFDYATTEVLQRVSGRTDRLAATLEVPVMRHLAVYGHGEDSTFESLAADQDLDELFSDLDRTDRSYRGGLRYYPTDTIFVGGGVGHSESDFDAGAADRSNSGDFWFAELRYDRPKLGVSATYEDNDFAGEPGSSFGAFTGSTGDARIEWRPRERLQSRIYASRSLAYSLLVASDTAYVDDRVGVGVTMRFGHRLGLDLFSESGSLDYTAELGGDDRSDDLSAYGAALTVQLGRRFDLKVGYRRTEITSNAGLPKREVDEIQGSLGFGLSSGSGTWY